eukprot:5625536-Amphidinium_carterae.1
MFTPSGSSSDRTIPAYPIDACQCMGSMDSGGVPYGSSGSLPYGPDRNDYRRNFDMSSHLYGSPPYGRSVAGGLHQIPSSSCAPCPPGL